MSSFIFEYIPLRSPSECRDLAVCQEREVGAVGSLGGQPLQEILLAVFRRIHV